MRKPFETERPLHRLDYFIYVSLFILSFTIVGLFTILVISAIWSLIWSFMHPTPVHQLFYSPYQ